MTDAVQAAPAKHFTFSPASRPLDYPLELNAQAPR